MFLSARVASVSAAVLGLSMVPAMAQSTYTWTTNYFSVAGDTIRDIRESVRQSRPWKEPFDAITSWDVRWSFKVLSDANGCRCTSFTTTTTIISTLPKWRIPANPAPETIASWTNFFINLADHEVGHGRLAVAATEEVQRRCGSITSAADCARLRADLNATAQGVVNEFRRREKEYDERTRHGAATFTEAPPARR